MRLILPTLVSFAALCAILRTARAQIFVTHFGNGLPGTGSISEYDATTGATVNPALVSGLNLPYSIAIVATVSEASSTGTLLLLALTATFGVKLLLRRPA